LKTLRSRYLAAGLVTLFLGLIVYFPARVAYQWFAPQAISFAGIEGTVWNGGARVAQANGVYLRDVTWRMRPLALATGKLSYAIEASPTSGFIEGNIGLGITGAITLTDLNAALSLQSLQRSIGMPGLSGKVNAQFVRVLLDGGLPVAAEGVLEVADLVAPLVHRASIGGYRAEFFTQESGVMASVEDTDGVIDLAGSLQISADHSYQFIALLAPRDDTPAELRQQMQFLGTANDRGQHELRLEGQL
jgi:general secretion pathway protein N